MKDDSTFAELVEGVIDTPFTEGHIPTDFIYHLHFLRGVHGAVSFVWSECLTPERLPPTVQFLRKPMGVDVGYHRLVRTNEWQIKNYYCEVLGRGVPCYASGSSLHAQDLLKKWQAVGRDSDFLRQYLTDYYNTIFKEK